MSGVAARLVASGAAALAMAFASLAEATAAHAAEAEPTPAPASGPAPVAGSFQEPPPEETEGAEYDVEPADSLDHGAIELGVGAAGIAGSKPRQTRRVRFSDRKLGGSVREGAGDPLAGGTIETEMRVGRVGVGRLAPRWGRGLVLGATPEPWEHAPSDRGAGSPFRGRSGQGAWFRAGRAGAIETIYGRFEKRELAGAHARAGGLGLGALADRSGHAQATLGLALGRADHEVAMDRAGRWRFEAAIHRASDAVSLTTWVRGGHPAFRSLAEPRRSGPSRVLGLDLADVATWGRLRARAALGRFGPGRGGARAALEVERRFLQHGSLAVGFEERHGTHRESGNVAGFRQGGWGEWRREVAGVALALRHEVLGARRLGRAAVRTVTAMRLEIEGPAGSSLGITHSAFRVRSGETLYLAEAASDRIVLRAVSGTGRRTRVEVRAPGAGGRLHAALDLTATTGARGGALRPRWTVDWTRRARSR